MRKTERTIILKHKSGWFIVHDNTFPSSNFCVFKRDDWDLKQNLPSHNVAYCGSLEHALNRLYQQLIIQYCILYSCL